MKKMFLCIVTLAASFLAKADGEEEDYVAYVDCLYGFTLDLEGGGRTVSFMIGDTKKTFEVPGIWMYTVKMPVSKAIMEYEQKYDELSRTLSAQTTLNNTIRAKTLANWVDTMTEILYYGLGKQEQLNNEMAGELFSQNAKAEAELGNTVDALDAAKKEWAIKQNALISDINMFGASQTAVATRLDILDTVMRNTKDKYETDLENVNEQLQTLEVEKRGVGLTDVELEQMHQLQVQAAELALTSQTAKKANNATQQALSKIKSLERKVDTFSPSWAATNCWNAVLKWQGFKKSSSGKQLKGVFLPPQKFNNSSGTAIPDVSLYGNDQSIFTMLSDAGIVPVLTDNGVKDWEARAGAYPKIYLKKGDKAKNGMTVEGEKKDDFLPISDWIDNDTITISDKGKYQAGKADKNVAATIQAFWNQHKSKGISLVLEGATEDMDKDNLWSTNNVLNPANPAFDKSNRNNIWNLLAYCGDSDVSPKDAAEGGGSTKALNSIQFLGSYSEAFGNAFSLYGFYKAKNGMFPYVEAADTENTLSWKMELEGGSERDAYSSGNLPDTIEVVKVSDDDSEVVEAEKRRILSLKGFDSAKVGQVAYKKSETELGWTGTDCFKFVGTDGGDGVVVGSGFTTNEVTFASATNSNVKVDVKKTYKGVTITFGVYYR